MVNMVYGSMDPERGGAADVPLQRTGRNRQGYPQQTKEGTSSRYNPQRTAHGPGGGPPALLWVKPFGRDEPTMTYPAMFGAAGRRGGGSSTVGPTRALRSPLSLSPLATSSTEPHMGRDTPLAPDSHHLGCMLHLRRGSSLPHRHR